MASVKVAVRVRPFNQREIEMDTSLIIKMEGKKTSILNSKLQQSTVENDLGRERVKEFTYDYSYWSFDPNDSNFATQEQVFEDIGKDVVDSAFEGYNACIFAYGQTGSGKTFTMMGTPDSEGLTPRICQALFARMKSDRSSGMTFRTEVSYLEIYNERVKDLLKKGSSQQNLRVREHPKLGPYVQDLSRHLVMDYCDVQDLMNRGNTHRTTAATAMNEVSSRSHAIFTLTFSQASFDKDMPSETVSKVNLVDLAGSERADTTGATGQRLKEGGHINKSLVTLGSVISALADMSTSSVKKQTFIPYRDSVLTWLLKDSLGGNSKTVMIATISPAECNYGETLSTLRYANRAKNILNTPTINEDPNVKLIRNLRSEISRLKSLLNDSTSVSSPTMIEKLHENEARVKVLTEEWTEKWKETHKILKEQRTLGLRKSGLGVVLDSELPHLVGIDDDLLSTGITLYHLKEGKTLIGTSNAPVKQDIVLNGIGIEDEHCIVELKKGVATLIPLGKAQCYVNTILIDKPTCLSQGCVVLLGKTSVFRYNDPSEVERLRKEKERGSTLNLSRMSLWSRSMSDLARSVENLCPGISEREVKSVSELELEKLEKKRQEISELEDLHKQAEEKRKQEQKLADEELERKRQELIELQRESDRARRQVEEAQKKIVEEQTKLEQRSLDLEKQFQEYLQTRENEIHEKSKTNEQDLSLQVEGKKEASMEFIGDKLALQVETEKLKLLQIQQEQSEVHAHQLLDTEKDNVLKEVSEKEKLLLQEWKRLKKYEENLAKEVAKRESELMQQKSSLEWQRDEIQMQVDIESKQLEFLQCKLDMVRKRIKDEQLSAIESLGQNVLGEEHFCSSWETSKGYSDMLDKLEAALDKKREENQSKLSEMKMQNIDNGDMLNTTDTEETSEQVNDINIDYQRQKLMIRREREKDGVQEQYVKELEVSIAEKKKALETRKMQLQKMSTQSFETNNQHQNQENDTKNGVEKAEAKEISSSRQLFVEPVDPKDTRVDMIPASTEILPRHCVRRNMQLDFDVSCPCPENSTTPEECLSANFAISLNQCSENDRKLSTEPCDKVMPSNFKEQITLQEANQTTKPTLPVEVTNKIQKMQKVEHQFNEVQEELDALCSALENQRVQENNNAALERFRVHEMEHQEKINRLVEQEVQRRLLEEQICHDHCRFPEHRRHLSESEVSQISQAHESELWCLRRRQEAGESRHGSVTPISSYSSRRSSCSHLLDRDLLPTLNMQEPIQIVIPSYAMRGNGANAHYEFEVKIRVIEDVWTIFRRYKRFRELHQYMKIKYGNKVQLPYFPPRKIFGSRSEKVVEERKKHLEIYLRQLVKVCSTVPGSPLCPRQGQLLCKQNLHDFAPFFRKGCFETSKHGTG